MQSNVPQILKLLLVVKCYQCCDGDSVATSVLKDRRRDEAPVTTRTRDQTRLLQYLPGPVHPFGTLHPHGGRCVARCVTVELGYSIALQEHARAANRTKRASSPPRALSGCTSFNAF